MQLDSTASAVVDSTSNAPAGTDVNECTVGAVPVLVSKLCIVTVDEGGVVEVVVKDQLKLLASAFPAKSFTPDAPPVIVAV